MHAIAHAQLGSAAHQSMIDIMAIRRAKAPRDLIVMIEKWELKLKTMKMGFRREAVREDEDRGGDGDVPPSPGYTGLCLPRYHEAG